MTSCDYVAHVKDYFINYGDSYTWQYYNGEQYVELEFDSDDLDY